jgi:rod shape-determining protein MreD
MINKIIKYLVQFIVLVLLQVLVLNSIQLSGIINPFVYIMLILALPYETPGWLLLAIALILGLTIDMFMNTLGMNAAATVMMAFSRPYLLKIMAPRDGYEAETRPSVGYMGFSWFAAYAGILTLIHHFVLFFIETGRFENFGFTLIKVIISSVLSLMLILIFQLLTARQKN